MSKDARKSRADTEDFRLSREQIEKRRQEFFALEREKQELIRADYRKVADAVGPELLARFMRMFGGRPYL